MSKRSYRALLLREFAVDLESLESPIDETEQPRRAEKTARLHGARVCGRRARVRCNGDVTIPAMARITIVAWLPATVEQSIRSAIPIAAAVIASLLAVYSHRSLVLQNDPLVSFFLYPAKRAQHVNRIATPVE